MSIDKHFFLVTGISIAFYFTIFFSLNIGVHEDIMYSTTDSKSYLAVANWLQHGTTTPYTEIRPILYPLLIWFSSTFSEIYGIWILQLLFWIGTVNLTFRSVYELTREVKYAYVGTIVMATNLSLIALTLHALTEVSTTFFLSVLVFFIVKNVKRYKEPFFLTGCLTILGLLTLIKPVFFVPFLIGLLAILPLLYLKKYLSSPIKILSLFILLLPVIGQLTLMKANHDTLTVSTIGSKTLTTYIFARGLSEIENTTRSESVEKAMALTNDEIREYVLDHKWKYFTLFFSNVESNIKAPASYLTNPPELKHALFGGLMRHVNNGYFFLHVIFLPLCLMLAFRFFKRHEFSNLTVLLLLYFLGSYYIVVSGVSFSQGDRLVLPAIAIWPCVYAFIVFHLKRTRTIFGD